ncbi:MAG: TAXI family TRAP transporter solute-binding subunit [Oscillospiraceae bacterium]|nr:TAXI family TRAP transporter solute-binding subunit [Oscillospiraceae bacterium]
MKKLLALLLVLILVAGLVACGNGDTPAPADPTPAPPAETDNEGDETDAPAASTPAGERFVLSSSTPGGNWYTMGGGFGALWAQEISDWPLDVMASSGGVENIVRAQFEDTDFWFSHTSHMVEARAGIGTAEQFDPNPDLMILTGLYPSSFYFATLADSGIYSMSDLAGTSIILGPPGGSTTDNSRRVLQALDLYDSVQASEMGLGDASRALQDGLVDVIGVGGHPAPAVAEIAQMRDVRVIPLTQAEMDQFLSNQPYFFPGVVPAETYPNQEEALVPFFYAWLCVGAWVPEDVVYAALTALFAEGSSDFLTSIHVLWTDRGMAEEAANASNLVFHPGAIRFFDNNPQFR